MIEIDDPNLQIKARGSIDLREGKNLVNIEAQLDTANFHSLKLIKGQPFPSCGFCRQYKRAVSLDSLEGTADFQNFQINYNKRVASAWTLFTCTPNRLDDGRVVVLETPLADRDIRRYYFYGLIQEHSKR